MGLRESLNEKPQVAIAAGAGLLVVALVVLAVQFSSAGGSGPSDEAYFTTDDGKTWFADDAAKLAPFPHDGGEAVRAYVFECPGGEPFVHHLERYTPEGRKLAEQMAEAQRTGAQPPRAGPQGAVTEVKKPGDKEWVSTSNLVKAGPMLNARCPDGAEAVLVVP